MKSYLEGGKEAGMQRGRGVEGKESTQWPALVSPAPLLPCFFLTALVGAGALDQVSVS